MTTPPGLSLPEWTVLVVLSQQPAHGFAVAQLTTPCGEFGRVWQIPRPVIYRAIGRLAETGLIRPQSVEPGLDRHRSMAQDRPQHGLDRDGARALHRWRSASYAAIIDPGKFPVRAASERLPRSVLAAGTVVPDDLQGVRSLPLQTWRYRRLRRLTRPPAAPSPCSRRASG
jgi:DNA-binding PadR family transcriptional regulator